MFSPELETLDQLLGGPLALSVIRTLYGDDEAFMQGVLGLLRSGDACLVTAEETETPQRRWRELFVDGVVTAELHSLRLRITDQGIRRIS